MRPELDPLSMRLQSWMAFFTQEAWLADMARRPLAEALDSLLIAPRFIADPWGPSKAGDLTDANWGLDVLLGMARDSDDLALSQLAAECGTMASQYMSTVPSTGASHGQPSAQASGIELCRSSAHS